MKKLFGNNIKPECQYCDIAKIEQESFICTKNKEIINNKCKKFVYNPLKRVPKTSPALQQFSPEDFSL